MLGQRQERSIARLLRQQAALAAFGSYAFREPLLHKVLTEAARVCAENLGVPFCKICRYREAENDLLIEAGHGWQPGVIGRVVSKADETSPQGRAYITGLPVIIQNLGEIDGVVLPAFYGVHGIVSTVDVIIRAINGEPYGVLEIDSPTQHNYDQHDVDFLTGFANVLAETVATARRNARLHQAVKKMEVLLAERDVLAEELKHRVRNNLQLVHGMLASHLKHTSGTEETASIHAIIRRVMTLAEVYEQLLGTGMGRTIDLGEYLKSLCASLPGLQTASNREVELTCAAESLLLVDLDTVTAMGMVVAELVSNSYQHALSNLSGIINVSLQRSERAEEAILTVRDNGTGFVERPGSKRHGVGLVRRLIQQVHGIAELRSEGGAVWTFRFPALAPAPATAS